MLGNSLQNKKIIISAGASGIGWATAKICLSRGAYVYLCDIDNKLLKKIQQFPSKRHFDFFLKDFKDIGICFDIFSQTSSDMNIKIAQHFFKKLHDNGYIYSLFGTGYIPHNVIIDHQGVVLFSQAGFNQGVIISIINSALQNIDADNDGVYNGLDNCPDDYNPYQEDEDGDGIGDVCDDCNSNIFYSGNLNGDGTIDIFDIVLLVDVILGVNTNLCLYEASDVNNDDLVNVLDVIGLVQQILGGTTQQAIQYLEQLLTPRQFERLTKSQRKLNPIGEL